MIDLTDPVQRNIHAIIVRDAIVLDDATDMALVDASPKQIDRQFRAMLPGVDFNGEPASATLDDPPGRRIGRVVFNPVIQAGWIDDLWTGPGPTPHRLPDSKGAIRRFIVQQTHLGNGDDAEKSDPQIGRLLGFSVEDHARIPDLLRANGSGSRLSLRPRCFRLPARNSRRRVRAPRRQGAAPSVSTSRRSPSRRR